jgi:hypothetical protein
MKALRKYLRKLYPGTAEYWRWFGAAYIFPQSGFRLDVADMDSIFKKLHDKEWDIKSIEVGGGVQVFLPPVEDVVAMKLIAGRTKDVTDMKYILNSAWGKLDKDRLFSKARQAGYEKKLLKLTNRPRLLK